MTDYVLELEADPGLVPTARMFAATLARQVGLEEDVVLDVKIAISEACTSALEEQRAAGRATPVRLLASEGDGELVYEVEGVARPASSLPEEPARVFEHATDGPPGDQELRLALIRALFPGAELVRRQDAAALRFSVSLAGKAAPNV